MNRTLIRLYLKNTAQQISEPDMHPGERRMLIAAALRRARACVWRDKYKWSYVKIAEKLWVTPAHARILVRTTYVKGRLYEKAERVRLGNGN